MTGTAWLQFAVLIAALAAATPVLGGYMAKVFAEPGEPGEGDSSNTVPGERLFGPVERLIYRLTGVNPDREQRWTVYAGSVLAFSLVSVLFVYVLQRVQGSLPGNPTDVGAVPPALAFNTSVSFVSNTNWQNYAGENTVSHLTQMAGLAVQNFVSAAVGMAVAIALVRGLVRRRSATIGNFWVDLTRATTRILLPLSVLAALVFVSQGAIQNFHGFTQATTLEGLPQAIAGGPFASQESIKLLGTNGGGTLNANSAHPLSNPNGLTNWLQTFLILLIPFALTYTFGKLARDRKQGWAVFAAMFVLWAGSALIAQTFEANGNPKIEDSVTQQNATDLAGGGNLEGKETRFGSASTGLFAATTTGTSTGAVDGAHDSFTPGGGAVPLVNMMLSEVSPGGVGAGLYGMLVFAILAVFIAGLMVGRTPEYLGKKIQAAEMKLIVLYILAVPIFALTFTGISVVMDSSQASILNAGPHGLTEVTYAFTSAANNNGSAFGGLTGNTDWYNTTLGLSMLFGRFMLVVPLLAIAGSLARKQPVPASAGTFPTGTPLFAGLLVGVVLIVVGLTYFPVLSLGPIVEHLGL
jgi:K+-transporting ATPase ATPase A chain